MALPVVNQNHIKNYVTTMLPSKFIKKAFVSSSFNHWFTDFLDFFASKVGLYHLQIDVAEKACVLRLNRKVLIRNFWWPKCYIDFVVPWILSVHKGKLLNFPYILALLIKVHYLNAEMSIAKMLFWFSRTKILLEIYSLKMYDPDHKYQTFCKSPIEHIFKYDPLNALQKSSWQSVN